MLQRDLLAIELPHRYLEKENTVFTSLLWKYMKKKIARNLKSDYVTYHIYSNCINYLA